MATIENADGTTTETWSYEEYWNVVLGPDRGPRDVVREFELTETGRAADEWLGEAEEEAWSAGNREPPVPEEWGEYHRKVLQELNEAIVDALGAEHVRCECGDAENDGMCDWCGPMADTVLVEYMPRQYRASHRAAGNSGQWPSNCAVRLRCERGCAKRLCQGEDERDARIVE